ncbi:hypothetical protein [Ralstonia sp. SET104]|uniref:hypothetical protein n=1 Tax=Ralstonia sp. SET104 TaxID=2448774 RepID=UPI000F57094A|nr:hypothetical protein [Ralstonia sp. SET104]GCB02609.1 hypothetical protein PSUB009319_02400 [Ralstonia sp. SET104]
MAAFLVTACGDPYETKLPADGKLTPTQTQEIVGKLPSSDGDLFSKWAKRQVTGEGTIGEPIFSNVRSAIRNQIDFEARQAAEREKEIKIKEEQRRAAAEAQEKLEQEKQALIALRNQRAAVDVEIKKYFRVEAIAYDLAPIFDRYGYEISRRWVFRLRLSNLSKKSIIGAAGWVSIRDAFGGEIGSFPMRIEPEILPGKTILFDVYKDFDKTNVADQALMQSKTLFPSWFMESVVFSDGTRVDVKALPQPAVPDSKDSGTRGSRVTS